jgi:hypothetical protein
MNEKLIGVLLVGAEGVSEAGDAPWLRDATEVETMLFEKGIEQRYADAGRKLDVRDLYVDGNGRPYWLKVVVDHPGLPSIAREKAEKYTRCVRLSD